MKTEQKWKINKRGALHLLPEIPDKSINLIITDLPYGQTQNEWDKHLDLKKLWCEYERIIKDNGAILLTSTFPYAVDIVNSNRELFRYDLIWHHGCVRGFLNDKRMPLRDHEIICVFYKKLPPYNPQMYKRGTRRERKMTSMSKSSNYGDYNKNECNVHPTERYPTSVIEIRGIVNNSKEKLPHSTQKPVALFEYLIRTYTNEGDTVHDSCLGSGTTLEACMNTNRNCIGFEISDEWEPYYIKRTKQDLIKLDNFFRK